MKRLARDEKGQALLTTLLFLIVGLLVLTPTLRFMGTGMISGRVYEQQIDKIYAADAGVEDALWHIRYDHLDEVLGETYDEYNYSTDYAYPYNLLVNGKNVTVTIQNVWIPEGIPDPPPPDSGEARGIIEDEKLLIVGYPGSSASTYVIKIVYYWESGQADDLLVKTLGLWLSPGFEYEDGSSTFEKASGPLYSDPDVSLYKGGQAVVWNFASQPALEDFPDVDPGDVNSPMVATFSFKYTGPEGQLPELVSSWIDTTGMESSGITYSWDDSIRLYKIVSKVEGLQIEAYGAKTKFRRLKSAISSDYTVAGNRLSETTGTTEGTKKYRDRLYAESSGTVLRIGLEEVPESGAPPGYIPEEAIIENVYLYWSGWIDPNYYYWRSGFWGGWRWQEIPDLRYDQNTKEELIANSKVDRVKFAVDDDAQTITADNSQVRSTSDAGSWLSPSHSWVYSCKTDITDLELSGGMTVQEYIQEAMKSDGSGTVPFTLGHADEVRGVPRPGYPSYNFALDGDGSTGYPLATPAHTFPEPDDESYETRYQWAYAGWSLIIFYRSLGVTQRQLYLYDDFRYVGAGGSPAQVKFDISGFLAPPVITEEDKSHLTYYVGEGDPHYEDSQIGVNIGELNGAWLHDPPPDYYPNPESNVFNSLSNALSITATDGLDVDIFEIPLDCILPYDASAEITLKTTREIYALVYLVLSFRSDLTTGGIITNYTVKII